MPSRSKSDRRYHLNLHLPSYKTGLPRWRWWSSNPPCQCRRHKRCGFNPWIGKIPWRRKWQPTPVFVPGESRGQRSLVGYIQSLGRYSCSSEKMEGREGRNHLKSIFPAGAFKLRTDLKINLKYFNKECSKCYKAELQVGKHKESLLSLPFHCSLSKRQPLAFSE